MPSTVSKSSAASLSQIPSSTPDEVQSTSIAYRRMGLDWPLVDMLCGGTRRLREEAATGGSIGQAWLPRFEAEDVNDYRARVNRSYLFGAYRDTVERIAQRPFQREVVVKGEEELDDMLAEIITNADYNGRRLTTFARRVMLEGVKYGLAHIFVDMPAADGLNRAQERVEGVRPYLSLVSPKDLIGWTSEKTISGEHRLTSIRTRFTTTESVGSFGERSVDKIRYWTAPRAAPASDPMQWWANRHHLSRFLRGVISFDEFTAFGVPVPVPTPDGEVLVAPDPGIPGSWMLFRKSEEDEGFVPETEARAHTYPGIPLITYYTNQTGFLEGSPPLIDLAWMNLAHAQSDSDYREQLRVAGVAMPYAIGITEEEQKKTFRVSSKQAFTSTNPEAEIGFAEVEGKSLGLRTKDLEDLEERMEVLGNLPFVRRRAAGATATGQAIDEGKVRSQVQTWATSLEGVLKACFVAGAAWLNRRGVAPAPGAVTLPDEFGVSLFKDFEIVLSGSGDTGDIVRMFEKKVITRRTAINELRRRGKLAEDLDVEAELEELAEADDAARDLLQGLRDSGDPDDDPDDDDDEDDDEGGDE